MTPKSNLVLTILTPEGVILSAEGLASVNVPLVDRGAIGIRPGHAPLIAETTQGTIHYRQNGEKKQIDIHAGVLDINENKVTILTAGELQEGSSDLNQVQDTEYNRLMQTLVNRLYPEDNQPEETD